MIEATFLHIPGIGRKTEQRLWNNGITSWDRFEAHLATGVRLRNLVHSRQGFQPDLFSDDCPDAREPQSVELLQILELSRAALQRQEYAFFLDRLDSGDHWRLLVQRWQSALYLDIETTGLSREFHSATVIGALWEGKFHQWVWPEPLGELFDLVRRAPLVVTFNGQRFDLPFLATQFAEFPKPRAHIDLLGTARAAEYSGGQKEVETLLGLQRDPSLEGVDGEQAVEFWCRTLYGDEASFHRLLRYNRADVEMLPQIAEQLCTKLLAKTPSAANLQTRMSKMEVELAHPPIHFTEVRKAWHDRRAGLHRLQPAIPNDAEGEPPVIVGIDLRGNPKKPTGWACGCGEVMDTQIVYDDEAIVSVTLAVKPVLVSIDAPLFLPRGRQSVEDTSPCKEAGGIVREVERTLWSRGIPVYPALILHMQGLTKRGMQLARRFRESGLTVIESYPGAAQDILGIPRKGNDPELLQRGLEEFGFRLSGEKSHDELDAVTSALVGYFFLACDYEAIGADDEGHMIIPRIPPTMRWSQPMLRPEGSVAPPSTH
jgi:uncharacterized protein YprB with RNaseH-like and TPR domain/predicted nuclease with RNAse H fold